MKTYSSLTSRFNLANEVQNWFSPALSNPSYRSNLRLSVIACTGCKSSVGKQYFVPKQFFQLRRNRYMFRLPQQHRSESSPGLPVQQRSGPHSPGCCVCKSWRIVRSIQCEPGVCFFCTYRLDHGASKHFNGIQAELRNSVGPVNLHSIRVTAVEQNFLPKQFVQLRWSRCMLGLSQRRRAESDCRKPA